VIRGTPRPGRLLIRWRGLEISAPNNVLEAVVIVLVVSLALASLVLTAWFLGRVPLPTRFR
jgi:hypothetical protein